MHLRCDCHDLFQIILGRIFNALSFQACEYGLRVAFVFFLASWYRASRSRQSSQPFVFGIPVNFETAIRKG
jgi:hypothetical protein